MNQLPKKIIFLLVAALLFANSCNKKSSSPYSISLLVGTKKVFVQIVKTEGEMERGLSGRSGLDDSQGMLFDFTSYPNKTPSFWMKDMLFDLDLIWIKNNKIIAINKKIPRPLPGTALGHLPTYSPPRPVDWVLEVNAGWSEKYNVNVGDEVNISDKN